MAIAMSHWVAYTVCFLFLSRLISCQCYYPNGDLSTAGDQPCSSDSSYGPCCPLNWKCLSNGLCFLENENYLGRYTCTDKTWEAEGCPNICTHNKTAPGDEAILECKSGNYCCDANRPDARDGDGGLGCCDTSNDFFELPDGNIIASIGIQNTPTTTSISASRTEKTTVKTSSEAVSTSILATDSTVSTTISLPPFSPSPDSTSPDSTSPDSTSPASTSPASTSPASTSPASTSPASTSPADSSPGRNKGTSTLSPLSTSVILVTSVIINSAGSSSSIVTSTIESQNLPATSSDPSKPVTSSNNLGTKIGLGAGIPIGILVFSALAFFYWRRQQKHKNRRLTSTVDPTQSIDPNSMGYMYKNVADPETPYTATTNSPEVDQRASGKYSMISRGAGDAEYRGASTGGLRLHPLSPELSDSPRPSKLSGSSPRHREQRSSQMSELAGSRYQPAELPERSYN